MDYYQNPKAPTPGLLLREFCLLALRCAAALSLAFHRCWPESVAGWKHVWHKEAWPLVGTLTGWGMPVALILACTVVVLADFSVLGIFFGVLGRLSALLLLVCSVAALLFTLGTPQGEIAALYSAIFFYLTFSGPGRVSLDGLLFKRRK